MHGGYWTDFWQYSQAVRYIYIYGLGLAISWYNTLFLRHSILCMAYFALTSGWRYFHMYGYLLVIQPGCETCYVLV